MTATPAVPADHPALLALNLPESCRESARAMLEATRAMIAEARASRNPHPSSIPVPDTTMTLEFVRCDPGCCQNADWVMFCPLCAEDLALPDWAHNIAARRGVPALPQAHLQEARRIALAHRCAG